MKRALVTFASCAMLALTSGCIVAPPRHAAAAVYVAPDYPAPGPGWNWEFHARYGWGWHHPRYGWHRGWG
jgi:hypothetical protein